MLGDGGLGGLSAPWPPRCPHPGPPFLISPWEGRGMARGRGDVLLWEGVLLRWGVVGAVREPPLRVGRRERGWVLRLGLLR